MRNTTIAILGGLALLLGSTANSAACDKCGCQKHVSFQKSHVQRRTVQKGCAQKGCGCSRERCNSCKSKCDDCGASGCRGKNRRRVGSHCGPMPQTCYDARFGCYGSGGRHMARYPAFHGHYYRRPYNYRNLADYPWHAATHEPTSMFSYNVPQEEDASGDAPGFENSSGPSLEDVAPPLPEEARRQPRTTTRQTSLRQTSSRRSNTNLTGYRR